MSYRQSGGQYGPFGSLSNGRESVQRSNRLPQMFLIQVEVVRISSADPVGDLGLLVASFRNSALATAKRSVLQTRRLYAMRLMHNEASEEFKLGLRPSQALGARQPAEGAQEVSPPLVRPLYGYHAGTQLFVKCLSSSSQLLESRRDDQWSQAEGVKVGPCVAVTHPVASCTCAVYPILQYSPRTESCCLPWAQLEHGLQQ